MTTLTRAEQEEIRQYHRTIDRARARGATVALVVAGALALAHPRFGDEETVDDDAPDSHHQTQEGNAQ